MNLPKVSIIIPVKPGGAVKALSGLRLVDYPDSLVEILVAEGRQPSRQRNRAAAAASGEILFFLDDDSIVAADFLLRAVSHFADPDVAVVGGPSLTPPTDTLLQKGFGTTLSSVFGGGGMRNRYRQTGEARVTGDHELILCNLAIRREVFPRYGGLDERLYPNEENELIDRLQAAGLRCIHDPHIAVHRSQRPTFRAFCRQLFTYGRGRAEQTIISRRLRLSVFIPSLFLLYLLLIPLADKPVYYLPLLCYAIMALVFASADARRVARPALMPLLLLLFPTLHLSYGAGMLWGLLRLRAGKRPANEGEITITRYVPGEGN